MTKKSAIIFFLQYKNSVSAEVMRNTLHICSANTEFFNQSNNLYIIPILIDRMLAHGNCLTLGYRAALIYTAVFINNRNIVTNRILRPFAPLEANHLDGISARRGLEPIDVFLRARSGADECVGIEVENTRTAITRRFTLGEINFVATGIDNVKVKVGTAIPLEIDTEVTALAFEVVLLVVVWRRRRGLRLLNLRKRNSARILSVQLRQSLVLDLGIVAIITRLGGGD